MDSKELPQIISDFNYTKVIQSSKIIDEDLIPLLDYVSQNYDISQKNFISFGLIARYKKLLSTDLVRLLQLPEDDRLRNYTARLLDLGMVVTRGIKKGTEFLVNPKLISSSKTNIKPSLKTIEPYRLIALVEEDLKMHPLSTRNEIRNRLPDIDDKDLKKYLYNMVNNKTLTFEGGRTYRRYKLA
jgi:ATP-dependent DNA helicase RecG